MSYRISEQQFCPHCLIDCKAENLIKDWEYCANCETELVEADEIIQNLADTMVWKGRYIDKWQIESYDGKGKVGLWLHYGTYQYIRVNFTTVLAILREPKPEYQQAHIHSKPQFKRIVGSRPFEIDFIKIDNNHRRLVGHLMRPEECTGNGKPCRNHANLVWVKDIEADGIRCFDLRRLIRTRVDGRVYAGAYLV